MRHLPAIGTVLLVTLCSAGRPAPAPKNTYDFFIGNKTIGDLEDLGLDSQLAFGAEVSLARDGWPIAVAVDILGSHTRDGVDVPFYAYNVDVSSTNFELDLGLRRSWEVASSFHPYFGGGISLGQGWLKVDLGSNSATEEANGAGYWIGAGLYRKFDNGFHLGVNVRHSKIDIHFDDQSQDVDIGGTHIGLLLGWGY